MSAVAKRVRLSPPSVLPEEIRVEIPRRGGPSPSSRTTAISGTTKMQRIIVISSTNYVPGRITFSEPEEAEEPEEES